MIENKYKIDKDKKYGIDGAYIEFIPDCNENITEGIAIVNKNVKMLSCVGHNTFKIPTNSPLDYVTGIDLLQKWEIKRFGVENFKDKIQFGENNDLKPIQFGTFDLKKEEQELINHPNHYGGENNPFETIKIIEAYNLDFCEGNALKYLLRYKKKNGIEDLKKSKWYIERLITNLEK